VAGCAVKFKAADLAAGRLKHLGITIGPDGLKVPPSVVPPGNQGKYSSWNVEGREIVRKDLPKETHYTSVETPNWGDSSNGTHTVDLPYEKYPREFHPPRELEILMNCHDAGPGLSVYVVAFKVQEVLDKTATGFEKMLFEDLNLLQENIGFCGVEAAEMALRDYIKSLRVSWEILPPGTIDQTMQRLFQGKTPLAEEKAVAVERYEFFMSLKPKSLVYGDSGFRRYFGALLEEDLVVFENTQYGNAVYVLFENWADLSARSRIDLIAGKYGTNFQRVVHQSGWKGTVREIVAKRRAGRSDSRCE
jgi:hypothetical protein